MEKKSLLKSNKTTKQHKPSLNKSNTPILKSSDLPATQGMLINTQKMFKSDLRSLEKKLDAKFDKIESKFKENDARFSQIDARFNQMDSKIEKVLSEIHRMAILMEEQNSRNQFVLDGYAQIYKRQDRLEAEVNRRLKDIEDVVLTKK